MKSTSSIPAPKAVNNDENWVEVNQYHELIIAESDLVEKLSKYIKSVATRINQLTTSNEDLSSKEKHFLSAIESSSIKSLCKNIGTFKNKKNWVVIGIINQKLSNLGVAPYSRGRFGAEITKRHDFSSHDKFEILNLCLSDLYWLHTHHRNTAVVRAEGDYQTLMEKEQFDYSLAAQLISPDNETVTTESKLFIHDDIQWELAVYKNNSVTQIVTGIKEQSTQVSKDLALAAHNNRRRGEKLLAHLPERIAVWESAMLAPNTSIYVMNRNYMKMTGSKIDRRTYRSKLDATNNALNEVDSSYVIDLK